MSSISKLAKYKVAKNTSVLMLAQMASRVLSILYAAALARYVGAEGIGKISIATALNGLLVLVVGPGLSTLLVRDVAADAKKAATYVSNILFLRGLLGIAFILLTVIVAKVVGYPDDTAHIIYAYTLVYLISRLGETLVSVFRAFERMEYEAGSQIVRDLINVSLSLLAIYLRQSLITIVFISIIAEACRFVLMTVLVYRRFARPRLAVSFGTIKMLLISSLPFGVLLILHAVHAQVGVFVVSLYHPEHEVGIYSAAYSLVTIIAFLPDAFSAAVFPAFSSLYAHARSEVQRFFQVSYKFLLAAGFLLGLGTMLVGDKVILLIYGDEFEGSAIIIRILAVFLFTLVGYTNGAFLNAAGKQRLFAWVQGLAVCVNGILCLVLVPRWGPAGAAVAFVSSGILTFFVFTGVCHRLLSLPLPWLDALKVVIATVVAGGISGICLRLALPWPIVLLVLVSTYVLCLQVLGILGREDLRILAGGRSAGEELPA